MKKSILAFTYILSLHFSVSQNINENVISNLNVETVDKINFISARVSNTTDLYYNLKYNFSVIVMDENYKSLQESLEEFLKSKESKNKTLDDFLKEYKKNRGSLEEFREEFFTINPFETIELYRLSLEINTLDKVIVLFLIFDDENNIISRSRVILNENSDDQKKITEKDQNKGFQLTGLVVEDTKTKSGKDFYDRFFFYYNFNNINGNQVVKVNEMFSFRRTTRIIVSVGDDKLAEFFAYPNEEYIEEMAKQSVQRVYRYFENKKKQKSYISQN